MIKRLIKLANLLDSKVLLGQEKELEDVIRHSRDPREEIHDYGAWSAEQKESMRHTEGKNN